MAPKKLEKKLRKEGKVKKAITIEKKKEIVEQYESGIRVTDLAKMYSMSKSTISTILRRKDLYKEASVAKGVTQISKSRSTVLDEVERLLLEWIDERHTAGYSLSESIICEKARAINAELIKDNPSTRDHGETFRASRGWFHNFKARTGILSVTRHGEAASADKRAATAESMGSQVGRSDVKEVVQEHSEESSTEELQQLRKIAAEELSEEGECQQLVQQSSSSEIKEILKKWTKLQIFVEKTHPDREKANRCIHLLNDSVMSYYRTVLKKRQKQTALHQFLALKRMKPSEPEAGPSGLQTLVRRERTPESQSPDALMEGVAPSKQ